ncbi:hypothetical protein W97_04559 [Coniosporium apollinis CBS 100218]|uniref:RRM domain-containing protein n=1 Tax=Coniosporium apollinis (strain CBS 100218) TaxID=1168221 RepID=R7YUG5_CONA1|nr:uncharacterized protein W97_04559 [Coniosporium apollinis CBS 100218]EON65321.1 hypothetical protein W97_04559 [Coniosporium apollinis CBS 100218]
MPGAQALTALRAPTQPPITGSRPAQDASERVRLHIAPLNPALLKAIVPPSLLPSATDISYHTIQTFPEKSYGYVELPTMEAQKLKKKLNGSILKGSKIRIEDARPEKRKAGDPADVNGVAEEQTEKPAKRRKKQKKEEGVIPGFELPEGRKVKRGWTEPAEKAKGKRSKDKDKAKKQKTEVSKYSKEPEMLFKTVVPPNKAEVKPQKKEKDKEREKKSRPGKKPVTVHELSKTMKYATFLKDSQVSMDAKVVSEYVEGKGWTDAQGNLIEPESERHSKRKRRTATHSEAEAPAANSKSSKSSTKPAAAETERSEPEESAAAEGDADEGVSVNEPIEGSSKAKTKHIQRAAEVDIPREPAGHDDDNDSDVSSVVSSSSSDVSSSSSESDLSPSFASDNKETDEAAETPVPATPTTKPNDGSPPKEVHPLEALFKRPKTPGSGGAPKPAPINTSFSFFDADAADEDEDSAAVNQPMTPFTRQDLDYRGLRSAAPTPDTAGIGLRFKVPWKDDDEDEGEDHDNEEGMADIEVDANSTPLGNKRAALNTADEEEKPESDFAKWFWEHRGETNRAWKRRRREVLKAKRQRENRKLGRRIV